MKKFLLLVSSVILLFSCEDKPSLQKYFVKNTESPKFIALDLASSIIKTDKISLTETEKAALESFDKMNILACRLVPAFENLSTIFCISSVISLAYITAFLKRELLQNRFLSFRLKQQIPQYVRHRFQRNK